MQKKHYILVTAGVLLIFLILIPLPHGLAGFSSMGQKKLNTPVETAINIYCRKFTVPDITFQDGTWNGGWLKVLKVQLDDDTIVRLDDAGEKPLPLDQIQNAGLRKNGWYRVCGINAGFFNAHEPEYGRASGAVREDGSFVKWQSEEMAPAYGSGNATVYFNEDGHLRLVYHGWKNGAWMPEKDAEWSYDEKTDDFTYHIPETFGVSGAYTLLINGKRVWLGRSHSIYWNASKASPVTLFGETGDHSLLLVIAEKAGGGEMECELMKQLGAVNAIRMDGGTSTSMVWDKGLVRKQKLPAFPQDE